MHILQKAFFKHALVFSVNKFMICAINEENSDCRILEEISAFVINYIYLGLYDFYSSHEFVFGYNKRNRKE